MLISFSVRNFRTFRERAEWSLVASPDKTREDDNVIDVPAFGLRLLKSAVVYGANASGKSKLVEAMDFMRAFVQDSSASGQIGKPTGVEPFRLNPTAAAAASEFEIQFIHKEELYRYGFEVSASRIEAEWLFVRTAKKVRNTPEVELFYRNGQGIGFHPKQFGGIVGELVKNAAVRTNALLLSVAAQFNQPRAVEMLNWFSWLIFLGVKDDLFEKALTLMHLRAENKSSILRFLEEADSDITDVREGNQPPFVLDEQNISAEKGAQLLHWTKKEQADVKTVHRAYTGSYAPADPVEFSLLQDESSGTQKLLMLAGPVLATLDAGGILVADELDARLHPNLVCKIVHLFNSKETNPHNAQLLFNTHDTNLLSSGNFRRDQIWFTEKNRYGEASLYSLADFKTDQKARKDDNFEANYVRGKYGAVPYLGNFGALPTADQPAPVPPHEEAP